MISVPDKDSIREIATLALIEVAEDGEAAPAARAAAARTLLESLGDIGRLQELARSKEKPLSEMTSKELNDEIHRLKKIG